MKDKISVLVTKLKINTLKSFTRCLLCDSDTCVMTIVTLHNRTSFTKLKILCDETHEETSAELLQGVRQDRDAGFC